MISIPLDNKQWYNSKVCVLTYIIPSFLKFGLLFLLFFVSPVKHGRNIGIMTLSDSSSLAWLSASSSSAVSHFFSGQYLLKECINFIQSL